MSRQDEAEGLRGDLAFFGRVTAGATHQINNVLSILNELHGLIEDLSDPARRGPPLSAEKLADITARCQRQITRGVGYVDRLNAFAHTVDEPGARLDPVEIVEIVARLADRPAKLRRATLTSEAAEGLPAVETHPFRLVRAVYTAVELALQDAGRGTAVVLRAERHDSGVAMVVESSGPVAPAAETVDMVSELHHLVEELAGRVEVTSQGEGSVYRLIFAENPATGAGD
jgi:hypothetical protein